MPYALLPPHPPYSSWHRDRALNPPKPKYTTYDRAVAQVFHSYGWIVLSVTDPPPVKNVTKSTTSCDGDGNDTDGRGQGDTAREVASSITRYSRVTELHHEGIVLDQHVFEGAQVADKIKWTVMWMAYWDMDKEVDLRHAL